MNLAKNKEAALPVAEVYDAEIACWPWQKLIDRCANIVAKIAPKDGVVIDYMCGTGLMLTALREKRHDLKLYGCDLSAEYVQFAESKNASVSYHVADAMRWKPPTSVDVVIATAGIHHLEWTRQTEFIDKVHGELSTNGQIVIGEETVGVSRDKRDREDRVVEFFTSMLPEIMKRRPSQAVIRASLEVFANDLLVRGEFKRDLATMVKMLSKRFSVTETVRIWPQREMGFGDYLIVGQRKPKPLSR